MAAEWSTSCPGCFIHNKGYNNTPADKARKALKHVYILEKRKIFGPCQETNKYPSVFQSIPHSLY
jgi:hypothetical protein